MSLEKSALFEKIQFGVCSTGVVLCVSVIIDFFFFSLLHRFSSFIFTPFRSQMKQTFQSLKFDRKC